MRHAKKGLAVLLVLAVAAGSWLWAAEEYAPQPTRVQQKMVLVRDRASYSMLGEDGVDVTNDDVLPDYLDNGWRVVTIRLLETKLDGYVIIERDIP